MAVRGRKIGKLQILRALEMVTPFEPLVFFPETAEADWAAHRQWLEPDALDPQTGALQFAMQSYLIRSSHHTVLVDTCIGNHKDRPTRPSWHLKTDGMYMNALAAHGIRPEDVDYVMCTHLHSDHVGWNTRLENGRWVPTFPNARYVFSEQELVTWRDVGDPKFSRQPLEDSVLPIVEAGRAELVTNDYALDDEIWLESTPGHTPDHVAIALASNGERAVMSGDILHSPVQCAHPEWIPWPDWDAALARQTRREFLERYSDTDTLVCTAHFPLPSAGRIVSAGDAFRFEYDKQRW